MPHESDEAIRRFSSSIRSGVRATSMPPVSSYTPSSRYWRALSSVNAVISLEWSVRKMKLRRVAGRAARVRQHALLEQDDVAPAEAGQVVGHAVADDAGADDDDSGAVGKRAHARGPSWPAEACRRAFGGRVSRAKASASGVPIGPPAVTSDEWTSRQPEPGYAPPDARWPRAVTTDRGGIVRWPGGCTVRSLVRMP